MLTAKSDTVDVVVGLESGADDYVVKPFKPKELVARIRARLRRTDEPRPETLRDRRPRSSTSPGTRSSRDGQPIALTPLEFDLLVCLARRPWQVFSREMLLQEVWGYRHAADTRLVNVHVQRLRAKIEHDPEHPRDRRDGAGRRLQGRPAVTAPRRAPLHRGVVAAARRVPVRLAPVPADPGRDHHAGRSRVVVVGLLGLLLLSRITDRTAGRQAALVAGRGHGRAGRGAAAARGRRHRSDHPVTLAPGGLRRRGAGVARAGSPGRLRGAAARLAAARPRDAPERGTNLVARGQRAPRTCARPWSTSQRQSWTYTEIRYLDGRTVPGLAVGAPLCGAHGRAVRAVLPVPPDPGAGTRSTWSASTRCSARAAARARPGPGRADRHPAGRHPGRQAAPHGRAVLRGHLSSGWTSAARTTSPSWRPRSTRWPRAWRTRSTGSRSCRGCSSASSPTSRTSCARPLTTDPDGGRRAARGARRLRPGHAPAPPSCCRTSSTGSRRC